MRGSIPRRSAGWRPPPNHDCPKCGQPVVISFRQTAMVPHDGPWDGVWVHRWCNENLTFEEWIENNRRKAAKAKTGGA